MPEGPEVEIVRRGLLPVVGNVIESISITTFPKYSNQKKLFNCIKGSSIHDLQRKGKFIIWYFDDLIGINHLGMTGVWYYFSNSIWNTMESPLLLYKHFKVYFQTDKLEHLLFNDTRTFGRFDIISPTNLETYPALINIGPDVLDIPFNTEDFILRVRGKYKAKTKEIGKMLLDSTVVAGCGNIYKSEALFRAGLNPFKSAVEITDDELQKLACELSNVTQEALSKGGSTLKDYRHVNGYNGLMQNEFNVYNREDLPCNICSQPILRTVQGDRSTFWCRHCQI
ncbi:MAG: bifunctional DNA-formamidopyrimidine glycosylase/DNA-(apurinic or apyrimidinic site) lyase [Candidatus Heimdallarchaeota archaeon]|nr:bifunctional DNA-formamidopyrimidine glycosylase/DNA-(apurinic or apyrimidinic site) lyase [Candidatus Heimdallarchaeota archaeon]